MAERANPFAILVDPPIFETKPKSDAPVSKEAMEQLAERNNFPSRQAPKVVKEKPAKRRLHRTGRDQQLNLKTSGLTKERFYRMADERQVTLCKLLEDAFDALERAGPSS